MLATAQLNERRCDGGPYPEDVVTLESQRREHLDGLGLGIDRTIACRVGQTVNDLADLNRRNIQTVDVDDIDDETVVGFGTHNCESVDPRAAVNLQEIVHDVGKIVDTVFAVQNQARSQNESPSNKLIVAFSTVGGHRRFVREHGYSVVTDTTVDDQRMGHSIG